MEQKITDILGRKINTGDVVALASRVGNSAAMKIRVIKEIRQLPYSWGYEAYVENPDTGRCGWTPVKNMLVVGEINRTEI